MLQAANKKTLEKKIINDKLKLPTFLTSEAHGLLKGLLHKNQDGRLTSDSTDPKKDVRKLKFFAGFNWTKLQNMEITPPFVPAVVGGLKDLSNFDDFWTNLPAEDSPANTPDSSLVADDPFLGYSYTHDDHLPSLIRACQLEEEGDMNVASEARD